MKFFLRYAFLILLFKSKSLFAQQVTFIDSILKEVQNHKINEALVQKALDIPYDKIVNDLNKCQFIFNALNTDFIFENNPTKRAEIKEKLALLLYLKGSYTGSLELHLQSIKLFEKAGDLRQKANAMAAMAYEGKKRNLASSIEQMSESIEILRKLNSPTDLASAIDNYGVLFELKGELDTAIKYYKEALSIKESLHDSVGIPYSLNNIAGVLFMKNNFKEGLNYINRSTQIRNKLGDYIGMAWNEYTLGELFFSNKDNLASKYHFQKSYTLAKKYGYPDLESRNMKYISSLFARQNKYDSAYFYFNHFFDVYDNLYNEQNQKQMVEMEALYETEKKETENKLLQTENELSGKTIKQQKLVSYFIISGLILALFFSFFIFRGLKAQRQANKIISQQKDEVHLQKEIVEKQKYLVEEHQKEILDSIRYAKRIQNALLAHQSFIDDNTAQNFVLFKPKDIVSGDFYWAAKHADNFYLACCDSTGHGVPGAFMSLLNIGFLSEAINEKEITEPNKILDFVRQRLTLSISKEGQKDGFDGILLCLNKHTNQITYSAAYNAPVLISNGVIHELEKDKMPVGVGERKENFALHTITLQPNDTLYLYTDGFADQFGGEKGKKFKYKQLNELLLAVSDKPLKEQNAILENSFNDWKGTLEQVDDVCVIGIRL